MLGNIFNQVLYQPLFNFFIFLYENLGHNVGLVIIILTILIRAILFPISRKSIKAQMKMAGHKDQIKEIQKKFKTKEEQSRELMKFYRENKINPFSGCLPLLIQLPILIALYKVFINALKSGDKLINPLFLGINLSKSSPIMAILAGIAQFFASRLTMKKSALMPQPGSSEKNLQRQKAMSKQMMYFFPILTVIFAWSWPAGLPFYWIISSLLGLAQDYYLYKQYGRSQKINQKPV